MALTPDQRKRLLGFGGLQRIATDCDVSLGHVSQINSEKRTEFSERIRDAISARIVELHPAIDPTTIWPPLPGVQQVPQRGGDDVTDVREHDRTISTQEHDHVPTALASGGTGANRTRAVR